MEKKSSKKNLPRLSFYKEIRKNKIYSFLLIIFVFIILLLLGFVIGLAAGPDYFFAIMILATLFSIVYVVASYYKSAEIALASVNARPININNLKERQFHHSVEGLALASGLPKPKLYVMENTSINAFASGRNPQNSVICVTTGALEKLNKQELEGVLSHEMSHIANYDIKFMTLTAVLVGMIAIISQIFLRSLWWRSFSGRGNRDNKAGAIFMIIGIVLAILAPIIVMLVQLAISRKREYAADSSAVKFMRTPTGLIGALEKIKDENKTQKSQYIVNTKKQNQMKISGAVSPLFISKPLGAREFFQTHPPLEKRIETLKRM
jgi:heat shock protein HtpX